MEIKLCINRSEKHKIYKIIDEAVTLEGVLRNESSIINPEILIEIENPYEYNYAKIPAFGRSYYITDMISVRNNIWKILMEVDVLESFATEILQQNVIVERSTKNYDPYLLDDNFVTTVKTKTDIINFPNGFLDSGEFILITAGG